MLYDLHIRLLVPRLKNKYHTIHDCVVLHSQHLQDQPNLFSWAMTISSSGRSIASKTY
ncbi:hypothetical protein HanIR_Chr07g0325151 [Helianthus annuus]|nr:hypothetical protein HanIR_Chr07g0325151 [Helianthus annuus]